MPAPHYTLTLSGSVQKLSDALGTGYASPGSARDIRVSSISIQADGGNSQLIYIGGEAPTTLTSTDYGSRIEKPVSTIPAAPSILQTKGRGIRPSDVWVLGTAAEKLHFQLLDAAGD